MKTPILFLFCSLMLCSYGSDAHSTQQQSIEDSVFGWTRVYHFTGAKKTKTLDNRVFSIAQLSICDSLANWMQASYVPKGGIGDIKTNVFPKANQYTPYNAAWPQGYATVDIIFLVLGPQ